MLNVAADIGTLGLGIEYIPKANTYKILGT